MNIKIVVHEAEEGGFWAEVPAIPGSASQGDNMEELMQIFVKQLRDAFPLKSHRRNRAALNGCWNCLHEIVIRPRVRLDH